MFSIDLESPQPSAWVSIAQAAALLGVHRDTIRRMIDRGEIRAERVGPRLIRVELRSVQRHPLTPTSAYPADKAVSA